MNYRYLLQSQHFAEGSSCTYVYSMVQHHIAVIITSNYAFLLQYLRSVQFAQLEIGLSYMLYIALLSNTAEKEKHILDS